MTKDRSVFASESRARVGRGRNQGRVGQNFVPTSKAEEEAEAKASPLPDAATPQASEKVPDGTSATPTTGALPQLTGEETTPPPTTADQTGEERTRSALKYQIRFTGETRNKLDALIAVGNLKGKQYEIIDTIIDGYIEEKLTDNERELVKMLMQTRKDSYID